MFQLDFMLSVFLVTHVEIKLASAGVRGNRGMENGVVGTLTYGTDTVQFYFRVDLDIANLT